MAQAGDLLERDGSTAGAVGRSDHNDEAGAGDSGLDPGTLRLDGAGRRRQAGTPMTDFDAKAHWERLYSERSPEQVSWYQRKPALSLALIRRSGVAKDQPVIDVGGGTSTLVDHLLAAGYRRVAVLDISAQALAYNQRRLGAAAKKVEWYPADVTTFSPPHRFALWHDRAVFHFLTEAEARRGYLESLQRALLPDGQVVIAAFGLDGPSQCSGLDVARYDAASLAAALGEAFALLESVEETHLTPAGTPQRFGFHRFARAVPDTPLRD